MIGGTGIYQLPEMELLRREVVHTPYGEPSGVFTTGKMCESEVVFLARHGSGHTIPPHKVNYRANIWALKNLDVTHILAFAAVGGITEKMGPEVIVIPDQIIDYTYGRRHTYFEEDLDSVTHIDFSYPYDAALRHSLLQSAKDAGVDVVEQGTYGATQGPRLESAAEITRMERDGCDIVGMTGMPETALARELELPYAAVGVVANWGAGRGAAEITMEDIIRHLDVGMGSARQLLKTFLENIDQN